MRGIVSACCIALAASPVMAASVDGIWSCSIIAIDRSAPPPTPPTSSLQAAQVYYAINSNGGTAAVMSPLAVGDYFAGAQITGLLVLALTGTNVYGGFSTIQAGTLISGGVNAAGGLRLLLSNPGAATAVTQIDCLRVW